MKKIIIGPTYPLRGGISQSNYALQSYFEGQGEDVAIVSYSLQYPKWLFPGKKQTVNGLERNVKNTFNLINTLNPFSWVKVAQWISTKKPSYVIVRYWHPYFAICLSLILALIRKKSIFIIAWIDNVHPHESVPFQDILTRLFLRNCDAFVVMSKSVQKDLIDCHNISNKKIVVSPHPIYNVFGRSINKNVAKKNLGISNLSIKNNDKYILFFGLVRKYKGLNLLLEVMASETIRKMNIKLIIAGEFYDNKENYMKKIDSLGIGDHIIIHDHYIGNDDVVNYFCASDIVVQPYITATQSGVSMVAYNFNKPMILTDVGGLSEYLVHKKNGYLVNPNVEDIVLALEDYYVNDREKIFSDFMIAQRNDYSWGKLARTFNELYKTSKYA